MTTPISLVRRYNDPRVAPLSMGWDELAAWLSEDHEHDGPKDSLPGWVPVEFSTSSRANENVKHVTCAVVDLDEIKASDVQAAHEMLRALKLDYAWHTSYSHLLTCQAHNKQAAKHGQPAECPADCTNDRKPKYRFVIRLSRAVAPKDWPRVWSCLAELFPRIDVQCKDPSRFYYVPGHRPGAPHDEGHYEGGQALDVDKLIAHAAGKVGPSLSLVGDAPTERAWRKLAETHANGMSAARAIGGRAMLALLDQEPFAPQGQRDTALFQIAAILAEKYPHSAPELLVDLVRAELIRQTSDEKWSEGDGAAELERKIARLQGQRGERFEGEREARLDQLGREAPYTEAEIREYCLQLGLRGGDQLKLQLLIVCRGTVYVFYEGHYYYAGSKDNAEELCRHRLQAAISLPGVTLQEATPKGVVEKTWAKLIRDYGTPVEEIADSLTATHTTLDLAARPTRLVVATAPRDRRRSAQFSPRADAFLHQMSRTGGAYEKLADWLATAPKLEHATAALYLHGAKGTGKTLLANALALIWGQRPTELAEAGASFNEHLAKCPIVFADESMPWEYRQDSGRIRRLITATNHALRQKYQDNRTLTGALRVILGANNLNMLHHPGETLDQWDVDAICERVLYIACGEQRAEYVPEAELADHILWLEASRTVKPDGRLWVTGVDSALHRALRTRGRHRAAVCQWLLKFVENPGLVAIDKHRWRMDETGLWIAPRLVHTRWDTYMAGERAMDLPQTTAAIFEISERGLAQGLVRVRLEDLQQFAEQVGWEPFCNIEDLTGAVSAGGVK